MVSELCKKEIKPIRIGFVVYLYLLVTRHLGFLWIMDTCPFTIRTIFCSTQNQLEVTLTFAEWALLLLVTVSHGEFPFPIHRVIFLCF
jgi:hypothetical protein